MSSGRDYIFPEASRDSMPMQPVAGPHPMRGAYLSAVFAVDPLLSDVRPQGVEPLRYLHVCLQRPSVCLIRQAAREIPLLGKHVAANSHRYGAGI